MKNLKRSTLGGRIAQARKAAGLSQVQLAGKLGVTQQMVAYLERQPVAIRPELLLKLSKALEMSVDELLGNAARLRRHGLNGRMFRFFEAASALPRSDQARILAILRRFIGGRGGRP